MSDTLLSISQAAKKLGVAAVTLRLWERQGKIKSLRTGGNQRRYSNAMLDEFMGNKTTPTIVEVSEPQTPEPKFTLPSTPRVVNVQTSDDPLAHHVLKMPLMSRVQKQVLAWVVFVLAVALSGFGVYKNYSPGIGTGTGSVLSWIKGPLASKTEDLGSTGSVLAAETVNDDYRFVVNVPALFNKNITAPNIIYGLTAGDNITITGGQNPTIAATFTNADPGSAQKIFKTVKVGTTEISAGSNTDTLTFAAGDNITIGTNTTDKKLTISASLPSTGWEVSGSIVKLSTAGNLVSIGTATGAAKLSVDNDTSADIFTASQSGNLMAKLDYNGRLNLATTGFDAGLKLQNSTVLYSGTGAPSNSNGSNGDYYFRTDGTGNTSLYTKVSGSWVAAGGGSTTLQDAYDNGNTITTSGGNAVSITGDFKLASLTSGLLYVDSAGAVSRVANGSTDQMMVMSGGVPSWTSNPGAGGTGVFGYWQRAAGALAPANVTDDFLVGGTSTASAKFAVVSGSGNITSTGTLTLPNSNTLTGQAGNLQFSGGISVGGGTTYYVNTSGNANFNTLNAATTTLGGTTVTSLLNSGSASVSGGLILYGVTTVSTTGMQSLNLGDSNTGNIVTSRNISATGTLTGLTGLTVASGTVSLPAGQIDSTELVGTDIATVGTITTGTWNGSKISEVYGGTNQSTYTTGDLLYASGTNTLAKRSIGNAGQVLTVSGGVPTWTDTTSVGNWQRNSGAVAPLNITDDVLVGATSTASAKIALNADTGLLTTTLFKLTTSPSAGYALISDASGNGSWTDLATSGTAGPWTLSGSTTFPDTATYNVLVGSATASDDIGKLTVSGAKAGKALVVLNQTGEQNILVASASGVTKFVLDNTGAVTTGIWNGTAINATYGGTNQTSWTTGDLLYASGTNTLSKLSIGSTNQSLIVSGGVPTWGTISSSNWQRNSGALSPLNITDDLLVGATSTASAKFSVISGTGNVTTAGTITLPNTNVLTGVSGYAQFGAGISVGGATTYYINNLGTANLNAATVNSTLAVTGATTLTGAFTANSTASISGALTLFGTPTIASTSKLSLTLGDTNTGNIAIGTDATARSVSLGNGTTSTALNFTSGTGSQVFTSSVATTGTTSSAWVFTDNSLTTGTGGYLNSSSITQGNLLQLATATGADTLTSGNLLKVSSDLANSTFTGNLAYIDWSPDGSTEIYNASADLLQINAGTYANPGNLLNISDDGSTIFSVSQTTVTSNLPTNFTSAGDVGIAYDLNFTNSTASYIKSLASLYLQAGESFGSSDLNLNTFNKGNVIVNSEAFSVNGAATISSTLLVQSSASVSGALKLYGTPTLQSTANQSLTLGGDTTGWVAFSPLNTATLTIKPNLLALGTATIDGTGTLSLNTTNNQAITTGTGAFNVMGAATVSASLALGPQSTDVATCNAANEGRVYYKGTVGIKRLYLCDGTTWQPIAAGTLTGGDSITTISPEYPNAVISADGSNNTGTFTSDREATGSGSLYNFNYYEFTSAQSSLQDYDIYVRFRVPENFSSWTTSNALTIDYETEDTSSSNNKIDVTVYQDNDADTVTSTTNVSNYASAWHSSQTGGTPISFTAAQLNTGLTWSAGSIMTIKIKLYSKDNYFARVGSIKFDWQ